MLNQGKLSQMAIESTKEELIQKAKLLIEMLEARGKLPTIDQQTLAALQVIHNELETTANWELSGLYFVRDQLNAVEKRLNPQSQKTQVMTQKPTAPKSPSKGKKGQRTPTKGEVAYITTKTKWRKLLKPIGIITLIYIFVVCLGWFFLVATNPNRDSSAMWYLLTPLKPVPFIAVAIIIVELGLIVWEKWLSKKYLNSLSEHNRP